MAEYRTVQELGRALAAGEASSREIVQRCLDRIAETDAELKAWETLCGERALTEADASDARRKQGASLGPLDGVPFGAKDLYDSAGVETRSSSKVLAGRVPDRDCTCVGRLREAGAVLLGKTRTHEFAYGAATPPVRNPWNTAHFPGGSSGGTGAAVAAGQVPFGLGTDTGGSIRIPTCFNGLSGIKATFGRVPKDGVAVLSWSTDHTGPMCHTAEDVALAMNVLAGHTDLDISTSKVPTEDYTANLGRGVKGLTFGVPTNYFPSHFPEVQAAVDAAVDEIAKLGAEVRKVTIPESWDLAKPAAFAIWLAEGSAYHQARMRRQKDQYTDDVRALILAGEFILATDYLNAKRYRSRLIVDMKRMYNDTGIDALLTPTTPGTAFKPDQETYNAPDGWEDFVLPAAIHCTSPFNITGQPALSVPCGFDDKNLPIGLQIAGRPWADALTLQVGHAYQQVTDWHTRRPTI